jgi:hypothetical protein
MRFEMLLLDGDDGYVGKCNMLRLTSHSSTPLPRPPAGNAQNQGNNAAQQHPANQPQPGHPQGTVFPQHAQQPVLGNVQSAPQLQQWGTLQGSLPVPTLQAQPNPQRIEYALPVVADLRFHRFWNFSGKQQVQWAGAKS